MAIPSLQEIMIPLRNEYLVSSTVVASDVVLIYDYILTTGAEFLFVWNARLSPVKIIFLLVRYLPLFNMGLGTAHRFGTSLTVRSCKLLFESQAWLATIGIALAELILTLRTWAVWNKDRRLTFFLAFFFPATFIVEMTIMGVFLRSTKHSVQPGLAQPPRCGLRTTTILSNFYIILMVYATVTLLLMVLRAFQAFRDGTSHFLRLVYRDGMVYYIYLFALSLANVLVITILPPEYFNLLVPFESFLHSILACRVVLHIREQANVANTMVANMTFPEY